MIDIYFSNRVLWLHDRKSKNTVYETRIWELKIFNRKFTVWKKRTGKFATYAGLLEIDSSGRHYKNRPLGHIVLFSEDFVAKIYKIEEQRLKNVVKRKFGWYDARLGK